MKRILWMIVTSSLLHALQAIYTTESVRLVNGSGWCSGRVEVKSDQSWVSVCEGDFDQQDAEVVCRELGCGAPSVFQGALYGEVEALMWTKEFQCEGNEYFLLDCRTSDSTTNTCSPDKSLGLTCSDPRPSVSVDPPGEVVEGSKVTLTCSSDANPPVDIYTWYRDIRYISTGPQLVMENVSPADSGQYVCQGTNRHGPQRSPSISLNVQGTNRHGPQSSPPISLDVQESFVRLVGGTSNCAGRLEVKHQGDWRPGADLVSNWNLRSSSVVCKHLNCGPAIDTKWISGSERQPVWWITSSCNGSEASLMECVTMQPVSSGDRLEVICSEIFRFQFSQCGRPEPGDTTRIVGGSRTRPGDHPWQVSLQRRTTGSSEPFRHACGGVLIQPCWVLTAALCIDRSKDMQVVLGGVYLKRNEDSDQVIPVLRAIVHKDYRQTRDPDGHLLSVNCDIALLQLNVTNGPLCAMETRYVKTACLPKQPFPDGQVCVVSGWGSTGNGKLSNRLLKGKVPLISNQRCAAAHEDRLDLNMICAGYVEGGGDHTCGGDVGGPLMCEQDGIHYVAGLVSWGPPGTKSNKPDVYTNVHRFVDWIKQDHVEYDYNYDDYTTSMSNDRIDYDFTNDDFRPPLSDDFRPPLGDDFRPPLGDDFRPPIG